MRIDICILYCLTKNYLLPLLQNKSQLRYNTPKRKKHFILHYYSTCYLSNKSKKTQTQKSFMLKIAIQVVIYLVPVPKTKSTNHLRYPFGVSSLLLSAYQSSLFLVEVVLLLPKTSNFAKDLEFPPHYLLFLSSIYLHLLLHSPSRFLLSLSPRPLH